MIANTAQSVEIIVKSRDKQRVVRKTDVDRTQQKKQWTNGYLLRSKEEFKLWLRVHRETFEEIIGEIGPFITKTPTSFHPNLIGTHRQLPLTLRRLAYGCFYQVIEDVFGVSKALAETFNFVICIMIVALYDRYVALPKTIEKSKEELKEFLDNYTMLPCIGSWDGFHVHVSTRLKNHYSFKHKYTISSMGLVGYNKRFLHVTCNAPGSTHDARLRY